MQKTLTNLILFCAVVASSQLANAACQCQWRTVWPYGPYRAPSVILCVNLTPGSQNPSFGQCFTDESKYLRDCGGAKMCVDGVQMMQDCRTSTGCS